MKRIICLIILAFLALASHAFALDGTYDAVVTLESGDYKAPVKVEDGKVVYVSWPNGEDTSVYGAKIVDGEADGTNAEGGRVHIKIDNYDSFPEVTEDPDTSNAVVNR